MSRESNKYATLENIGRQFGITKQAVLKWEQNGAPLHSEEETVEWLLTGKRITGKTRRACLEYKQRHAKFGGAVDESLPDESTFSDVADDLHSKVSAAARGRDLGGKAESIAESNSRLAKFTDYYASQLADMIKCNDPAGIEFWGKQYRASEKIQQEGLILAKKLGVDNGELLKKEDAETYLRAVAYWLVRGVDSAKRRLREHITATNSDLVLDANLLAEVFVGPIARACRVDGPTALPGWAVETLADAVDDYVENGAEEFRAVKAEAVIDAP